MTLARTGVLAFATLLAAAVAGGCGGGGGGGGGTEITLPDIVATTDGHVSASAASDASVVMRVGDDASNGQVQGLLRFPLTGVLPGDTIVSATLLLERVVDGSVGDQGLPLSNQILISPTTLNSSSPDDVLTGDFDATPVTPVNAVLTLIGLAGGLGAHDADVTALVAADVAAGDTVSDFRLYFQTVSDNDNALDVTTFATINSITPAVHPRLRIVVRRG